MVKYFVRIGLFQLDSFIDFCNMHRISHKLISMDGWQEEVASSLYKVQMTHQDALALKILMNIFIMETQYG